MRLDPNFRGADEVVVPDGFVPGWTSTQDDEARYRDKLQDDLPFAFRIREPGPIAEEAWQAWQQFQLDNGRYAGSCDWTLLDRFVLNTDLHWLPQIIGSCVASNTFRGWTLRLMFQNTFYTGEPLGRNEFGQSNWAPYAPYNYGYSRKRGNLRGGDGSFCGVMAESLLKDGVVLCGAPSVQRIHQQRNLTDDRNFPEPQGNTGAKLYRDIGNWQYLDDMKADADYQLLESPSIKNTEQLLHVLGQGKPAFVCSGEAIRKTGTHPDGFSIHERDPGNSWAHNMCFHGVHVASDGEFFIVESNESWGKGVIYRRRVEEVERSFRAGRLTVQAIGEIAGPLSQIPEV